MKGRRWLSFAVGIPAGIVLFLVLTISFIPDRELQSIVARGLEREGYSFQATRFGKSFPLGIKARNLTIGDERGAFVKADQASARLQLLPLLLGRISVSYHARIGAGTIDGDASPRNGGMTLDMNGVNLEDIPFFQTVAGTQAKGIARLRASLAGTGSKTSGTVQLEVRGADLRGVKISETPLPDASYNAVQGMLRVNGGKATLESFTLQGEGLYARIKGDMPVTTPLGASPLNLTLELMPKPDFLEKQKFVFLLLVKYLVTPGHYQIPIKGVLSKPAMQ